MQPQPPHKRSARKWVLLFFIWGIGLAVWTIYIVAIIYLITKIL